MCVYVYICIYICIYIYIIPINATSIKARERRGLLGSLLDVCVYAYVYMYIHIICIEYLSMLHRLRHKTIEDFWGVFLMCVYVYLYVYLYVFIVYLFMYLYVYIYMYIYI